MSEACFLKITFAVRSQKTLLTIMINRVLKSEVILTEFS